MSARQADGKDVTRHSSARRVGAGIAVSFQDEPSAGLSPGITEHVFETINTIRSTFGKAVAMVEQNVKQAIDVAGRVPAPKTGAVVYDGKPDNLADDSTELMMMFRAEAPGCPKRRRVVRGEDCGA